MGTKYHNDTVIFNDTICRRWHLQQHNVSMAISKHFYKTKNMSKPNFFKYGNWNKQVEKTCQYSK